MEIAVLLLLTVPLTAYYSLSGSRKHSIKALKLRPRRALQRGCQLGTCQLHNLANTLYHFSNISGKEESKRAKDPQGYGR
uniref:Adrenomedullin n=1 Tax=Amphilophus citrinellus TaxID=61819 RepID=A0A3Q0SHS8_AMPCI